MTTIKVAVGTESAIKIRALKAAFASFGYEAEISGAKTESGVNVQPVGLDEMETGARNRAQRAKERNPEARFYVGIENGLVRQGDHWYDPTCIVVLTLDAEPSVAYGAFFPIPTWMAEQAILKKTEFDIGQIVQGLAGGGEKDAMKYLSEDTVHREQLLTQAIQCALSPIFHPKRFKK
jgi:inosine/xanthosine triphosphatase